MVAWIEEPPSDKASKFDRLLRRSKLWQTRAPYRTRAGCRFAAHSGAGAALSTEVQQAADEIKQAPPAQEQRGVLGVKTTDGFIVDVTNTTDGRVALIAAPDAAGKPDFTKPLTQVLASDLQKRLVTQAWLAKHQLNAPANVRRSARFKQKAALLEQPADP